MWKVKNRKVYLSPLLDLHSLKVLGYSTSLSPNVSFVIDILEDALNKDKYEIWTLHSDQGIQHRNKKYRS